MLLKVTKHSCLPSESFRNIPGLPVIPCLWVDSEWKIYLKETDYNLQVWSAWKILPVLASRHHQNQTICTVAAHALC